ncbi:MAG: fumarylacetoacetate hydrolase family protein [Pseudolabrys sp.]
MTQRRRTTVGSATDATLRNIASEAVAAFNSGGRHVQSFSARYPEFTLDDAYRVTALANEMRVAKGYKPIGRKAGFTNRQMWDEYGVRAPNWGYVYDRTLHDLAVPLLLAPYSEPKIEPEIMFGLAAPPSPGMDDAALLSCIAWVAHGFEIVQSIFPGWKFSLPDCTAANAMHGALLIGPRHDIGTNAKEWLRALAQFEVELYCDGKLMERGRGSNVLEGPISAVRYLVELLARDPNNPPLAAGEIVSTGTLTRALPVKAGETWTTKLKGIALEDVSLRFE